MALYLCVHKHRDFERFEEASRRPCSSALLMSKFSLRLASSGAAVIIVVSAIELFSQQILRPETHESETPDFAVSFGLSQKYGTGRLNKADYTFYTGVPECASGYSVGTYTVHL